MWNIRLLETELISSESPSLLQNFTCLVSPLCSHFPRCSGVSLGRFWSSRAALVRHFPTMPVSQKHTLNTRTTPSHQSHTPTSRDPCSYRKDPCRFTQSYFISITQHHFISSFHYITAPISNIIKKYDCFLLPLFLLTHNGIFARLSFTP